MKKENKQYASIGVLRQDKDLFDKLNSDWNILNPTMRKRKEEFFRMILNKFREQLKQRESK